MKSGTKLERILTQGHFAVTAELGPPKSANREFVEKKAGHFEGAVDAVNITDNQTAIVRMSSIAAAKIVLDAGQEPVIQMTCRDRNRIGMQSDILGAYALGIRNILCLSGDHVIFGNHPTAKSVFDVDSIQLVAMVKKMRDEKRMLGGDEIKAEPRMFIGAAANPFASPEEYRALRLAKKVRAGADFIQTQCIFDLGRFRRYMKEVVDMGLHEKVHILAGILPVKSHRALEHMRDNVPGVIVPEGMIKRMKGAEKPADEGVAMAVELIQEVKEVPGVAGVHIMAMMWEEIVPVIVKQAGLFPRPMMDQVKEEFE